MSQESTVMMSCKAPNCEAVFKMGANRAKHIMFDHECYCSKHDLEINYKGRKAEWLYSRLERFYSSNWGNPWSSFESEKEFNVAVEFILDAILELPRTDLKNVLRAMSKHMRH